MEPKDRRYERVRLKVPVYIAEDGGTFRKVLTLESRDISPGGLCFETSHPIQLFARSKVVISKLGDLPEPVLIHARVAHVEQDPVTGRHTVGLEFLEFVNVTPEAVMARIDAWANETTPGPESLPVRDPDGSRPD